MMLRWQAVPNKATGWPTYWLVLDGERIAMVEVGFFGENDEPWWEGRYFVNVGWQYVERFACPRAARRAAGERALAYREADTVARLGGEARGLAHFRALVGAVLTDQDRHHLDRLLPGGRHGPEEG